MSGIAYHLKGHPIKGYSYSLGADCAGGTGLDYSSAVGLCQETNEQVFELRNNFIDPLNWGRELAKYGKIFNEALLVVESNQHGLSTLAILKEIYPKFRIYKQPQPKKMTLSKQHIPAQVYGWRTSTTTKPYMVGMAQLMLQEGVRIYSPILYDELVSFSETETGRLEGLGDHDDTAIAFMLACIGLLKLRRLNPLDVFKLMEGTTEVVQPRTITPTWRDNSGRVVIPFNEIFQKKREKATWVS